MQVAIKAVRHGRAEEVRQGKNATTKLRNGRLERVKTLLEAFSGIPLIAESLVDIMDAMAVSITGLANLTSQLRDLLLQFSLRRVLHIIMWSV
ncbi:hypothetical protein PsorP6_004561 [Peronosclerospora sorghi]|uniref:Uncharacterized protein n=1 Tax=Peronosclerospora sorghi TaxID=230839 RepID=A0ACC0VQX8_9STRA|nr:hypothetical protein PsorP6_004561 [Peronosclerospora sorghi]